MSSITGKGGCVYRQVTGVDTVVSGIKEWSVDYVVDMLDITEFTETGVTYKSYLPIIKGSTGSLVGNHTDGDTGLDLGSAYNILLSAHSDRSYYGSAYITSKGVSVVVDGEATTNYSFEFSGKVYVLGADVVVDGGFTAATSAAWDVSDDDVSYHTTNNQLDWGGDAVVAPSSDDVVSTSTKYWTQVLIENESGTSTFVLQVGQVDLTERTANGTYTEIMTSDTSDATFEITVTTSDAISLSEIIIRPILN